MTVNIVNLVDSRRNGEGIVIFPTKRQFIDYTWPERTYPLGRAKNNSLMAALLRPVSTKKYSMEADREMEEYKAKGYTV